MNSDSAEPKSLSLVELAQQRASRARDHLANERTFLSWLRFGLAFSAFGFVVARFGLFVEQLVAGQPGVKVRFNGLSVPVGIGFVVVGVLLALFAARRFFLVERELERGEFGRHYTLLYLALAAVALGGLAVVGYLVYDWLTLRP